MNLHNNDTVFDNLHAPDGRSPHEPTDTRACAQHLSWPSLRCTMFYRGMLKLPYTGSDANSSTFLLQEQYLQEQYLILFSVSGAKAISPKP